VKVLKSAYIPDDLEVIIAEFHDNLL